MQDRPTIAELLESVERFIATDVVPVLDGPTQFHARVAANVLAIVRRELAAEETQTRVEWERLTGLLGRGEPFPAGHAARAAGVRALTLELAERIRRGDADAGPWRTAVLAHVRQTVVEKLAVANPKYLAADPVSADGPPGSTARRESD